jgi:cytochrome c oxidase cbb3-type subunit 3
VKDLKKNKSNESQYGDTGHEWDGIKELNTPDPFWLRALFYVMLFFSLGYWFLYPSFPGQQDDGILNWSSDKETIEGLKEIQSIRDKILPEFNKASFEEILKDPKLLKFAITGGKSAFHNNCSVCHGIGGSGNKGYPKLAAGAWIWGGKPDDIYQTLKYGIRSEHPEARDSQMAAFGQDKLLTEEQIRTLVPFVMGLHDGTGYSDQANAIYQANCASCHGKDGAGNREVGAPSLKSGVWLYGGDEQTIYETIYYGRMGVMPYWEGRLDDPTIRQLTIYVHQLGGGE